MEIAFAYFIPTLVIFYMQQVPFTIKGKEEKDYFLFFDIILVAFTHIFV